MSRTVLATLLLSVAACQAFLSLDDAGDASSDASLDAAFDVLTPGDAAGEANEGDTSTLQDGGVDAPVADGAPDVRVIDPRFFPGPDAGVCPPTMTGLVCPDAGEGVTKQWMGRCYFLAGGGIKNFGIAPSVCAAIHPAAYPVTVTCAQEWAAVTSVGMGDITWMGYQALNNLPAWQTGEPFTFAVWDTNNNFPRTDGTANCILTGPNQGLRWQSAPCSAQGNVLCEIGNEVP